MDERTAQEEAYKSIMMMACLLRMALADSGFLPFDPFRMPQRWIPGTKRLRSCELKLKAKGASLYLREAVVILRCLKESLEALMKNQPWPALVHGLRGAWLLGNVANGPQLEKYFNSKRGGPGRPRKTPRQRQEESRTAWAALEMAKKTPSEISLYEETARRLRKSTRELQRRLAVLDPTGKARRQLRGRPGRPKKKMPNLSDG